MKVALKLNAMFRMNHVSRNGDQITRLEPNIKRVNLKIKGLINQINLFIAASRGHIIRNGQHDDTKERDRIEPATIILHR